MKNRNFYIINGITLYRLLAAPVLVVLIFTDQYHVFKWLLALSFFTDLIDGFLARKFGVTSVFGSRIDSIGDDLTVLAGIIGAFVFKTGFIREHALIIGVLFVLLITQNVMALLRYRKISSFHTYSAKTAAVAQGCFLILLFILPAPLLPLFYLAALLSAVDLLEEIILVMLLPDFKTDVKGIYWVLKLQEKNKTLKNENS